MLRDWHIGGKDKNLCFHQIDIVCLIYSEPTTICPSFVGMAKKVTHTNLQKTSLLKLFARFSQNLPMMGIYRYRFIDRYRFLFVFFFFPWRIEHKQKHSVLVAKFGPFGVKKYSQRLSYTKCVSEVCIPRGNCQWCKEGGTQHNKCICNR